MINKEYEKIIKDLIKYDIRYPLIVEGADHRKYKINKLYTNVNKIMIEVSIKGITTIEKLRVFSLEFQKKLITKLKTFKTNI